jgi:hypothetical protein
MPGGHALLPGQASRQTSATVLARQICERVTRQGMTWHT